MLLMRCPEFPERKLAAFGSFIKKSSYHFKKMLGKLDRLIKGSRDSKLIGIFYLPTPISEELIEHGFGPFDHKNRSFSTNVNLKLPPEESRKNLKELIAWLCDTIKSQHVMPEGLDLLRGKEPSFYGLSMKQGKLSVIS